MCTVIGTRAPHGVFDALAGHEEVHDVEVEADARAAHFIDEPKSALAAINGGARMRFGRKYEVVLLGKRGVVAAPPRDQITIEPPAIGLAADAHGDNRRGARAKVARKLHQLTSVREVSAVVRVVVLQHVQCQCEESHDLHIVSGQQLARACPASGVHLIGQRPEVARPHGYLYPAITKTGHDRNRVFERESRHGVGPVGDLHCSALPDGDPSGTTTTLARTRPPPACTRR